MLNFALNVNVDYKNFFFFFVYNNFNESGFVENSIEAFKKTNILLTFYYEISFIYRLSVIIIVYYLIIYIQIIHILQILKNNFFTNIIIFSLDDQ
jgi:hypothetical protein